VLGLDATQAAAGPDLRITRANGQVENVPVRCRIDTPIEIDYYQHGGFILPFVLAPIGQVALNCPSCDGAQMEHFNYSDTSGIILHKCPECDGIWADKDELQKIEEVVDGWKACLNKDLQTYGPVLRKVEAQEKDELDRSVSISRFGFVNAVLRHFCD
jgi:Zn-finger nucleic acid-binding protein